MRVNYSKVKNVFLKYVYYFFIKPKLVVFFSGLNHQVKLKTKAYTIECQLSMINSLNEKLTQCDTLLEQKEVQISLGV